MKSNSDDSLNKCPVCGGRLEQKRVTHPQHLEGNIIILENVPAEVCRQCGEVLLAPSVVEQLQKVVWSAGAPKRTAVFPVYDLAEIT